MNSMNPLSKDLRITVKGSSKNDPGLHAES